MINPAATDEQGRGLPGAHPNMGGGPARLDKVGSPLDLSNSLGIIGGSGSSGSSSHMLSPRQGFPEMPGEEAAPEAAGAGEAAGGAAALEELAPLALLA